MLEILAGIGATPLLKAIVWRFGNRIAEPILPRDGSGVL